MILYILLYYGVNIQSFIVTYLSCGLIGYYFQIFILFYFIIILIPRFWFDLWDYFVFQDHFATKNPLCTDPKLYWQYSDFL